MCTYRNYIGFMTVDYEDGVKSTYKGLHISFEEGVKVFNSGDPLIDWYEYCKYVYNGDALEDGITSIAHSSNVDHWFMDDERYVKKYLKYIENENRYDFITRDELNSLSISDINKKLKCVVSKDMKSFQELKDYYKQNKK